MWFLFSVLSVLAYAASDMLGKKNIVDGTDTTPVEMLVSTEALSFLLSIVLYIAGFGESRQAPWQTVINNPLILASQLCFILYWLLFLFSMRFAGLSVQEAVSGVFGICYFAGLLIVNLVSGKLSAVRDMLHPMRFIPIIIIITFTFLLPNTEVLAQKRAGDLLSKAKTERRRIVFGLLILIIAVAFDSADSLINTFIMSENKIGIEDYIIAAQFSNLLPILFFLTFLRIKNKKRFIPFENNGKSTFYFAVFMLLAFLLYMLSARADAVRTGLLFTAYPVVPIIGAKVILKEKYTWRQELCIWIITAASVVFCISDYVI